MTDIDDALIEQVFDISERRWEPDIQHDRKANNLAARVEIAARVNFGHEGGSRNRPAPLKLVGPDSAGQPRLTLDIGQA